MWRRLSRGITTTYVDAFSHIVHKGPFKPITAEKFFDGVMTHQFSYSIWFFITNCIAFLPWLSQKQTWFGRAGLGNACINGMSKLGFNDYTQLKSKWWRHLSHVLIWIWIFLLHSHHPIHRGRRGNPFLPNLFFKLFSSSSFLSLFFSGNNRRLQSRPFPLKMEIGRRKWGRERVREEKRESEEGRE